jgi:hypothetical protein
MIGETEDCNDITFTQQKRKYMKKTRKEAKHKTVILIPRKADLFYLTRL